MTVGWPDASDSGKYHVIVNEGALVGAIGDDNTVFMPRRNVDWPIVLGSPPLLASAYCDRPSLTARLTSEATLVLSGGGGVGKSQQAANAFRSSTVDLRLWVSASSRASVTSAYADAAVRLDLADPDLDSERLATTFLEFLAASSRSWLVVLDDIWDPTHVAGLWPSGAGAVVATTRRRDAALSGSGRLVVDVSVFTPEESLRYLADRLATAVRRDTLSGVDGLGEDLGFLPLGLAQAAAVVLDEAITCDQYRARFADRAARLDELFPQSASADGYSRTVATTWSLAIETADRMEPRGVASPLAQLISLFDPNGAPEEAFENEFVCGFLSAASEQAIAPARARMGLRALDRLSLISHDPNASNPRSVRMHLLTGRAIRETLDQEYLGLLATSAAAGTLIEIWPTIEKDRTLAEALRTNALSIIALTPESMWNAGRGGTHGLIKQVGESYLEAGLGSAARDYWSQMRSDAEKYLGIDHPDTFVIRGYLARSCRAAGELRQAVEMLERLLVEASDPGRHRSLLPGAQADLAGAYLEMGEEERAISLYEKALKDTEREFGPSSPSTVQARSNLGNALRAAGDTKRAIWALERAVVESERWLGPDSRDTLACRNNLAGAYYAAADFAKAASLLERNLMDYERIAGPDHLDTLRARDNLGGVCLAGGDATRAVSILEENSSAYERIVGLTHRETLMSRQNLAGAYWAVGDRGNAESLLERLVSDCELGLSTDHPFTARTRQFLAEVREGSSYTSLNPRSGAFDGRFGDNSSSRQFESPGTPAAIATATAATHEGSHREIGTSTTWRGGPATPLPRPSQSRSRKTTLLLGAIALSICIVALFLWLG